MKERRTVALLGDSLLMDAVEAGLSDKQEFGVARFYTPIGGEERLSSLNPDLLIFDLDTPDPGFIVRLLRDQPGVPLLGLELSSSKVIAISSQQQTPLTADELAQMIRRQTSRSLFHSLSYRVAEKKIGHNGLFSGTLATEVLQ